MIPKSKLEKLYKSGLSMKEIANRENWLYYTVKYWMERHNISRRSRVESSFYGYWNKRDLDKNIKKLSLEKVKDLYYKQGYSVPRISNFFDRSISSIYRFMKRNGLLRRSIAETNNIAYDKKDLSYVLKDDLTKEDEKLRIAGIMLYWAEGYKNLGQNVRGGTVDLANSDPRMIDLFLKFLRNICGVDEKRLRVYLYCYSNQNIEELKEYWSKLTKISLEQFTKPYVKKDFKLEKKDKMKYGLVHIRYSDKKLFLQIKNWTEEYLNEAI